MNFIYSLKKMPKKKTKKQTKKTKDVKEEPEEEPEEKQVLEAKKLGMPPSNKFLAMMIKDQINNGKD